MGRHVCRKLEKDLYDKLINIKCDYFDRRSIKEIVNKSLKEYIRQ